MKSFTRILLLALALLVALAVPGRVAFAQDPDNEEGKVIVGGSYRLSSGETLSDDLVIIGGSGTLEKGSTVNGDVALTGGILDVNGEVNGDVVAIGGTITLGDDAHVNGNVSTVGAVLNRSEKAKIDGSLTIGNPGQMEFPLVKPALGNRFSAPSILEDVFGPISQALYAMLTALVVASLAAAAVLFVQKPTENVAAMIVTRPLPSLGMGLLTVLVAPLLIVILTVTIVFIPVMILFVIALGLAALMGWIALGLELGRRIGAALKVDWAPAVYAGLGTLALTLLTTLLDLIPCLGAVIYTVIGLMGLGAVLLSRFGLQREHVPAAAVYHPANTSFAPIPPVTPAAIRPDQAPVEVAPAPSAVQDTPPTADPGSDGPGQDSPGDESPA